MKKKPYITLFIISIIFLGIGGTLAAITASGVATNITQIKSGNLTMTVDGGGSENVSLMPASCTSEYAIKKTINASAKNTSGGRVSFSIGMNITTLGDGLKRDTMKYALTTSATSCTDGLIASGNFANKSVGSDVWLIKNDYDNITNTGNNYNKTYYLYIWLDSAETQNVTGSVSVTMKGTTSNNPNLETEADLPATLYNMMRKNASNTTINFAQTSAASNTNGIYTTTSTDSGNPVYYYRGNVDNRLIFADFCWRIVRTTETGGVKIVYDGVPSNGQCNNTGADTTIGSSAFNSSSNSPAYVGYMYGVAYSNGITPIPSLSGPIVFGNDITYSNGIYTLTDTYTVSDISNWSSEYSTVASRYHYTCFTNGTTCTTVDYIYSSGGNVLAIFSLNGGKNHLDILNEMLDNSSNTTSSTIKITIDNWYQINLSSYTSQLEDTVFCNDRTYHTANGGFDANSAFSGLYFNVNTRLETNKTPTLQCSSNNDKFTVNESNGNGDLTYPIGLLSADEVALAGIVSGYPNGGSNSSYYLYNGINSWVGSPWSFTYGGGAGMYHIVSNGGLGVVNNTSASFGVRPAVSLKPGIAVSGGTGTATDPYIVE